MEIIDSEKPKWQGKLALCFVKETEFIKKSQPVMVQTTFNSRTPPNTSFTKDIASEAQWHTDHLVTVFPNDGILFTYLVVCKLCPVVFCGSTTTNISLPPQP